MRTYLRFTQPLAMGLKVSDEFTYPFAEFITATSIASEMKSPGGNNGQSIRLRHRGRSRVRHGVSNKTPTIPGMKTDVRGAILGKICKLGRTRKSRMFSYNLSKSRRSC
jgi:hypothetical protein